MNIVLLRVGIDKGIGGIHGPLFRDGTFEFIPIPVEGHERTYSEIIGVHGKPLITYFPRAQQERFHSQTVHEDPDFTRFCYGDLGTGPKRGLKKLIKNDIVVFYCGLEGWDFKRPYELYIVGYFEVLAAGSVADFSKVEFKKYFNEHIDVKTRWLFHEKKDTMILIKGTGNSHFLKKAIRLSCSGKDKAGRPLKVLSPEMQKVFGDWGGNIGIQRSTPRWVQNDHIKIAYDFVKSLE